MPPANFFRLRARHWLVLILFSSTLIASEGEAWDIAVRSLVDGHYQTALTEFVSWGEKFPAARFSPEWHRNVAKANWELAKPSDAVFHLAQSARYSFFPWDSYQTILDMQALEHELGVKESVSSQPWFASLFLAEANWVSICLFFGAWCLFWILFLRWKSEARMKGILLRLLPIPVFFFILAAAPLPGFWVRKKCAVLGNGSAEVALFRNATRQEKHKLLDLPSGTVILVGETKNDAVRLSRPVSGWVAENEIRWLFR